MVPSFPSLLETSKPKLEFDGVAEVDDRLLFEGGALFLGSVEFNGVAEVDDRVLFEGGALFDGGVEFDGVAVVDSRAKFEVAPPFC